MLFSSYHNSAGLAEACSRGGGVVRGGVMCVRFRPLHMLKSHPGFENYKINATPGGVDKGLTI